uniref:Uncharacterized protein n=1 Tax=Setaria viridis TaxID=4556 RepID=A0A4U6T8D8_SETVI|nr:hypothetical protein SEVIR_9G540350v2 [Setaria viridis]
MPAWRDRATAREPGEVAPPPARRSNRQDDDDANRQDAPPHLRPPPIASAGLPLAINFVSLQVVIPSPVRKEFAWIHGACEFVLMYF